MTQVITKAPVHPCLLQHYSQYSSYGNSQNAPLPTNEENVVLIHSGILFSHKEEGKFVICK
jgi:hypothetical protein